MSILDNVTQKSIDKAIGGKQKKEISIADEAIDWMVRERNCLRGKLSGSEQYMTCPQCQDGKIDKFSINIESLMFNCFKVDCGLKGIGLNGPEGLKAKLDYDYKSVPDSHNNQNKKTAEKKEKEQSYLLSKTQADALLIPVDDFLVSDENTDDRGYVNDFIEKRNYDKDVFLSSFDVRVARKGTEFEQNIFATDKQFTITAPSLVWCLTDDAENILHMLRRPLGIDGAKTNNCCGSKRIYLSKAPEIPITDKIFIVEGITCATAIAHICQSAALLGGNITQEYVQSEQLEIFRDKDVVYGVDADVPDETVQKDMEILANIAKSVIRLKAKQPQGGDGKRDWNDMLIDGRDQLKEYIIEEIKTATPFISQQTTIAEKEKKEAVVVEPVKRELQFPGCAWRGLFDTYRQAHKGCTETPDQFHFACFKTIAGILLGRTCYVWCAGELFPNYFTILMGPTKKGRKSTAANFSIDLLSKTDEGLVRILRGLSTPEGLIAQLQIPGEEELNDEDSNIPEIERRRAMSVSSFEGYRLLVFHNEFASLLKKAKRDTSSGIIQCLTDAYDCPETLDVPTRTYPLSARQPIVSTIGLSTKSWLEGNLSIDDLRGGFVNRHTFYLWTETSPIPDPPPPDQKLLGQITKQLHDIRQYRQGKQTQYTFSSEAKKLLTEWYNDEYYTEYDNEAIDDASQRIDSHVRKLALLYAVLENEPDNTEIHLAQLETAIQVGAYWKAAVKELFGSFGFSKAARADMKLLELIQENQYTKRELQMRIGGNMSAPEFNKTLKALVEAERVLYATDPNNKKRQILIIT